MKSLFTIVALGTASLLSADSYSYPQGQGYTSNSPGQAYYNATPSYEQNQGYNQGYSYSNQGQVYYNSNPSSEQSQNYYRDNQGQISPYHQGAVLHYDSTNQGSAGTTTTTPSGQSTTIQVNIPKQDSTTSTVIGQDQDVVKSVHDVIGGGWFSRGYENVSFTVNNGVVTLRGTVNSLEQKNRLEEDLKKIKGVTRVDNQVTVATPDVQKSSRPATIYTQDYAETEQDKIINGKIRDKLSSGWFVKGNDRVSVKTINGAVTISGVVDNYDDIQKVNDQLKGIDGVKSISNQLSVKKY